MKGVIIQFRFTKLNREGHEDIIPHVLVDVICECGKNGPRGENGELSCEHGLSLGPGDDMVRVSCDHCGRKYILVAKGARLYAEEDNKKEDVTQ